jgi:hypothetical protein
MKIEQKIQEIIEKKGYTSRSCRFLIIEEMLGISPEDAKAVETITRTIRQLIPKDEVGARLEQAWKMPDYMRPLEENKEWNNLFKRTNQLQ